MDTMLKTENVLNATIAQHALMYQENVLLAMKDTSLLLSELAKLTVLTDKLELEIIV